MNLKEQLAMKKAELLALKDAISKGDSEAIKAGEELAEAIATLENAIAEANKAHDLLAMIGDSAPADEPKSETEDGMKGLIAKAKSVDTNVKGWSVHTNFKANTTTVTAPQVADVDKTAAAVKRARRVADLFGAATVSGNAVTYYVTGAIDGDAAVTEQGAKKAQISTSFTAVTKALEKVTAFVKETSEILDDAPFLASTVEDIINYKVVSKENAQIVSAISSTSGIGSITYGSGSDADNLANGILLAKSRVAQVTDYEADCVILNPTDLFKLMTAKDTAGQYVGYGYMGRGYFGENGETPTIWGLPIFESSNVEAGKAIVAAGKQAVKVYRKGDVSVKIFDQNEDDAIYNIVTVLGEERLIAAVKDPNGVVVVEPEV